MPGIIFAVLSGFFIALQNVFNATIGTEVSIWSTAMITQAVGGAGALLIYLFKKDEEFRGIRQVKPLYLFGGSFGALVVASSVIAVSYIGAAVTNASILLGQLGIVVLIETFGFFNMNKQPIARKQIIGLAVMMVGAILISM